MAAERLLRRRGLKDAASCIPRCQPSPATSPLLPLPLLLFFLLLVQVLLRLSLSPSRPPDSDLLLYL